MFSKRPLHLPQGFAYFIYSTSWWQLRDDPSEIRLISCLRSTQATPLVLTTQPLNNAERPYAMGKPYTINTKCMCASSPCRLFCWLNQFGPHMPTLHENTALTGINNWYIDKVNTSWLHMIPDLSYQSVGLSSFLNTEMTDKKPSKPKWLSSSKLSQNIQIENVKTTSI